jgi:Lipid desaturase domain
LPSLFSLLSTHDPFQKSPHAFLGALAADTRHRMKPEAGPFFLPSTPLDRRLMRMSVAANLAVMTFCAGCLVLRYDSASPSWPCIVIGLLAGYFCADFASGLVHWAMDTWFSGAVLGRAVAIAREHHTHPRNILAYGFLEHAALGSAPSAVFIGLSATITACHANSPTSYFFMIIWLVTSTCLLFGTSLHNLGHKRPRSALVRMAQTMHLIISPEHHLVHHRGGQIARYCVINGWANYPCDRLHVWRGLERLVRTLTGAVPRSDDHDWQRRYRQTGTLFRACRPDSQHT